MSYSKLIGKFVPENIGTEVNMYVNNPGEGSTVILPGTIQTPPIYNPNIPVELEPGTSSFRTYQYYGKVMDKDTGAGIPGASLEIYSGDQVIRAGAANANGEFQFSSDMEADSVLITSVGYKGKTFPLTLIRHEFELEKDEKELDPVVVTSSKKKMWILAIIAGVIIADHEGII